MEGTLFVCFGLCRRDPLPTYLYCVQNCREHFIQNNSVVRYIPFVIRLKDKKGYYGVYNDILADDKKFIADVANK